MVKRVYNAIHNPAASDRDVRDIIREVKANHIFLYKEDYDEWVNEAIYVGSEGKLMVLLSQMGKPSADVLTALLKYSPHTIPRYMASRMFNPNTTFVDATIVGLLKPNVEYSIGLNLILGQPRAASIILRLANNRWFTKPQETYFMNHNPVLYKRKQQRKTILRFWLVTTKRNLGMWKETLYVPGTGALYKKALRSFTSNTV